MLTINKRDYAGIVQREVPYQTSDRAAHDDTLVSIDRSPATD